MAVPFVYQALDSNGDPYSGAKAFFYQQGTTTPQAAYTATDLATATANPLVADSAGRFTAYLDPDLSYTVTIKDSTEAVTVESIDFQAGALAASAAAAAASAKEAEADAEQTAADRVATTAARNEVVAVSVTGAEFTPGGPVAVATTANITLSGEQTIDGVTTSTDRILVKDQSTAAENGIYVTAAGAWSRATDMNDAAEVEDTAVYIQDGTTNGGKAFVTYSAVTTLGTDDIDWVDAMAFDGVQSQIDDADNAISVRLPSFNTKDYRLGATDFEYSDVTTVTRDGTTLKYTIAANQTVRIDWEIPTGFSGPFMVAIPGISGTYSAATVSQRDVSQALVSGTSVTMTEKDGCLTVDNQTLDGSTAFIRVLLTTPSGQTFSYDDIHIATGSVAYPVTDADYLALQWLSVMDNLAATSLWSGVTGTTNATDNGDGTYTVASGVVGTLDADFSVASGTDMTILLKVTGDTAGTTPNDLSRLRARIVTGGAGGNGAYIDGHKIPGTEFYYIRGNFATGDGNAATNMDIEVGQGDIDIKVTIYDVVSGLELPLTTAVPAVVTKAIQDQGVNSAYFDPAGDDANAGTRDASYESFSTAITNSDNLFARVGLHRVTPGLSVSNKGSWSLRAFSKSGDTERKAYILASTRQAYSTATAADANVYYIATSTDPEALFEIDTTAALSTLPVTRLGVDDATRPGRNIMAADEAAVRSNAGSWWFGTGSEGQGIYVHPTGSSATNKAVEVPSQSNDILLAFADVASLEMEDIEFWFAQSKTVSLIRSRWKFKNVACRYAATNNGFFSERYCYGGGVFIDCEGTGNFEDGLNMNGSCHIADFGSRWNDNGGDGASPHFENNEYYAHNVKYNGNGKIGFPDVSTSGTYDFTDCEAINSRGNSGIFAGDMTFENGGSGSTVVRINNVLSDLVRINPTTASTTTATIKNHTGAILLKCDTFDVDGIECVNNTTQTAAVLVTAGTGRVDRVRLLNNTRGIRVTGGAVTVGGGTIADNTTAQLEQTGGTATIDTDYTLDVRGSNKISGTWANPTGDHIIDLSSGGGGGGASDFVDLGDTPANFTGAGSQILAVNSGASAVEFIASVPVAQGGTGSTTASAARTALGLAIGTDVQAFNDSLSDIAGITPTTDGLLYYDGANYAELTLGTGLSISSGTLNVAGTISFLEETIATTSGSEALSSADLPAGAVLLSLGFRITTTITGPSTIDFGHVGGNNRFLANHGTLTAGTTGFGVAQTPHGLTSAAKVRIGADGVNFTGGEVKVSVAYIAGQIPAA